MERCVICGKPLEKEESIVRGMGDVCASRFAGFKSRKKGDHEKTTRPQSDYNYQIIEIAGAKVGLVIDKDTTGYMSVTNNIDEVCKEIGVENVIYRDSEGVWDFWSDNRGFVSLAKDGVPSYNMDTAIEIAKVRVLGNLGGLFEQIQSTKKDTL